MEADKKKIENVEYRVYSVVGESYQWELETPSYLEAFDHLNRNGKAEGIVVQYTEDGVEKSEEVPLIFTDFVQWYRSHFGNIEQSEDWPKFWEQLASSSNDD